MDISLTGYCQEEINDSSNGVNTHIEESFDSERNVLIALGWVVCPLFAINQVQV